MSTITLFEEKQVRRAWEQATGKWYFAIVDVIAVLTDSANPQVYWRVMKKRLADEGGESVTKCNALRLIEADGTIAGNARRELEAQSGTRIATRKNFKTLPESQTRPLRNRKPKP